eukprot:CAMPEP_0203878844 /NCGR_PEP_ID=MMETSP0359-20131031/23350_1 /ASSEMBLY_ACC=CAM_ASM_000338 /TAXON_ID=268821 /ORGANISM="Scrippsiella Hangoei, Strain SHTV-5" /LENGTH=201 /DNA_ID=CAMNT_0050798133 /DNA_START=121 /DNA_END=723 /DNA_ORIENTATION=+
MTAVAWRVEVIISMLCITTSVVVQADTTVSARNVVRAKMLHGEIAAMKRLLNLSCDVAAELDDGLCIVEPVPRLMAMLTLDYRQRSMQGVTLQQFMPHEEDRCRFESVLQASGGDGETPGLEAGALHATLRASGGTLLEVEIFYVRFSALDNRGHYLVGIREFSSDHQPLPQLVGSRLKSEFVIEAHVETAMAGPHDGQAA